MEGMKETEFKMIKKLRLWKVGAKDEGARMICKFLENNDSVVTLDVMGNEIGVLGCEFFG